LREAFDLFDADKTGSIDLHELKVDNRSCSFYVTKSSYLYNLQVLMRALGFDVKKPEVVKMVHDIDPNNAGSVDYEQFLELSAWF